MRSNNSAILGFIKVSIQSHYESAGAKIWVACGLITGFNFLFGNLMGNKIVTEADRKRSPKPIALPGTSMPTMGKGQRISLERGVATRSKKNPGKRSSKGG
jgi:hypothetical protein